MRAKYLLGLVGAIVLMFALGAGVGTLLGDQAQAAAEPTPTPLVLPFSHRVHAQEIGIDCLFCHSQALRAPQADLPSLRKCMVCHEYITLDESEAQAEVAQLKEAYDKGLRVQWPDVYKQPDFVYFSHRPHVTHGVACETCHGDVKSMDLVVKQVEMDMGFCLDCHLQQPEDEKERLIECMTCHK